MHIYPNMRILYVIPYMCIRGVCKCMKLTLVFVVTLEAVDFVELVLDFVEAEGAEAAAAPPATGAFADAATSPDVPTEAVAVAVAEAPAGVALPPALLEADSTEAEPEAETEAVVVTGEGTRGDGRAEAEAPF